MMYEMFAQAGGRAKSRSHVFPTNKIASVAFPISLRMTPLSQNGGGKVEFI